MLIGTVFLGKVKKLENQWVETTFVIFGIPLYPTDSMLVTSVTAANERRGIPIPLDKKSVIAGYLRGIVSAVALIMFVAALNMGGWMILLTGAVALLWYYLFFLLGKPSSAEIAARRRIGKVTGYYALPEWLDRMFMHETLPIVILNYKSLFKDADWKEDLQQAAIPVEKRQYLYVLALFESKLRPTAENSKLFDKINKGYTSL